LTVSVPYRVISQIGEIEVRKYPFMVLAKVKDRPDDSAFSILFDYISGNNQGNERIPMTAPVVSQRVGTTLEMTAPVLRDADSFAFVLPPGTELRTAPRPVDPRIELVPVPSRLLAVLRFSGRAYQREVMHRERELMEILRERGVRTRGSLILMRYNSPFTPGFLRRNEVAVEVDPGLDDQGA
jgi:hypothetical protein